MKKSFICILILLLCMSFAIMAVTPENASLKLRGSVPVENVKISMIDENGMELNDTNGEIAFVFSAGTPESVSHTISMRYSANLPASTRCEISFELSDLVYDQNSRIKTSMELFSSDSKYVTVDDDATSLLVTFLKGISTDRELASITITATKGTSSMLPTGEYEGTLVIKYTSAS